MLLLYIYKEYNIIINLYHSQVLYIFLGEILYYIYINNILKYRLKLNSSL